MLATRRAWPLSAQILLDRQAAANEGGIGRRREAGEVDASDARYIDAVLDAQTCG